MEKYVSNEQTRRARKKIGKRLDKRWVKNLKYIAAFAFVGTLAIGGLAIWGAVTVVNKLASADNQVRIQEGITTLQTALPIIASQPIMHPDCLAVISEQISPAKLLTVSVAQNFETVRKACWSGWKN